MFPNDYSKLRFLLQKYAEAQRIKTLCASAYLSFCFNFFLYLFLHTDIEIDRA